MALPAGLLFPIINLVFEKSLVGDRLNSLYSPITDKHRAISAAYGKDLNFFALGMLVACVVK